MTANGNHGNHPSPAQVAEHLSLPLLAMVQELSRQQEEMAKLLRRKDKEIDDYKVRYGPPSRR